MPCPYGVTMPMRRPVTVMLGLALVVAVAHGGAIRDGFLYDDFQLIVDNPAVQRHDWGMIWTSAAAGSADVAGRKFRPITLSTYAVDHLVGGGRAAVYHATQVAWHGLVVLLAYLVGRAVWHRPLPAIAAALLVAVHPVQTEAVHYLSARASILSTLGMLGALWAYLARQRSSVTLDAAREGDGHGRRAWFGLSLAAFAAACLSKESGVVFVVWLAAYEAMVVRTVARDMIVRLAPYLAVAVAAAVWQHLAAPGVWGQGASVSRATGVATGVVVLARHVAAWVAPIGIEPVSPQSWTVWTDPAVLPAVAWLAGTGLCLAAVRRVAPLATWGGVCGVAALLPVMVLPFMTDVALFQPHRGYTASVGFALATVELARMLAAWGLPRLNPGPAARMPAVGLATGLVLLAGTIGFDARQGRAWRDEVRFWSEAAARHPDEAAYAHSLGAARLRANDAPGAAEAFSTALRVDPMRPRAQYNLGLAYTKMGRLDEARDAYERAVERDPSDVKALANLGLLYEQLGDIDRALEMYRAALHAGAGLERIKERVDDLERIRGSRMHPPAVSPGGMR